MTDYSAAAADLAREWTAPDGQVWVCQMCGKHNKRRDKVGDESCFLNAVLCYDRVPWEAVKNDAPE